MSLFNIRSTPVKPQENCMSVQEKVTNSVLHQKTKFESIPSSTNERNLVFLLGKSKVTYAFESKCLSPCKRIADLESACTRISGSYLQIWISIE